MPSHFSCDNKNGQPNANQKGNVPGRWLFYIVQSRNAQASIEKRSKNKNEKNPSRNVAIHRLRDFGRGL